MMEFSQPVGDTQAWGQVGLLLTLLKDHETNDPRWSHAVELCKELRDEIGKQVGAAGIAD